MDNTLDLKIHRIIRAPREAIWQAWTNAEQLAQWWMPAPLVARIDRLEVKPGGAFVASMSENGTDFVQHQDGIFLVIEPEQRLVWTNAISSAWRPADPQPVSLTAEIILADHPDGTAYTAIVRHGDPAAKTRHEELGFFEGWGAVTDSLAALVER